MTTDHASALPHVSGSEPRPIHAIILATLREAPPRVRRSIPWIVLACGVMVALQVFDIRGRRGPEVVAEVLSVVLGSSGLLLVALMNVLHGIGRDAAQRTTADEIPGGDAAIRQILLALPAVGFSAGVLLAAAIAIMVMRGVLGATPVFVAALTLFWTFLIAAAARTINQTTRLLYTHARDRAAAAAHAQAQAADARLWALQAQLNPHFLFNALNTVAALARSDPAGAEATVENLADVLRRTLARSTVRQSTLGEEVEYLRAYLAIEQRRMGARLRVEWDVPDPLLAQPILPLALQPLVENSLKHGIGSRLAGGTIRVAARRSHEGVRITVADDGEGFPARLREGTGLRNLRERVSTFYGPAARVDVERPANGASVTLILPDRDPAETDRARIDSR